MQDRKGTEDFRARILIVEDQQLLPETWLGSSRSSVTRSPGRPARLRKVSE